MKESSPLVTVDRSRKKGKCFMPINCSQAWSMLVAMYKKGKSVMPVTRPVSCSQASLMGVSMYIFTEWPWETVSEGSYYYAERNGTEHLVP